jgi:predicted dehydrogenase
MSSQANEIGVVLAGGMRSHQENYASAFAAEGCRLLAVGLADGLSTGESVRHSELAQSLGLPLLPLVDALRLPGASVASVCVSLQHRTAVALDCARAGLHLYLDKPLAGSAADAAAISAAVEAAKVKAQVFSQVTAGWARRAREAILEGRLGRIVALHADTLMAKGVPAALPAVPRNEIAAPIDYPEDIAKREMTDMGIYPVSLVAWLLGTRALTVSAATANHFFAEHLSRDVEDYGAMLLAFEGGQEQLVLTTSRGLKPPQVDAADPMSMWLSTRKAALPLPAVRYLSLDPEVQRDVATFVAGLTDGGEMGISVEQAAHHCEILAAAYRSAAEHRDVALA